MSFLLNSTFGLFATGSGGGGGTVTGADNGTSLNGTNVVLGNDTGGTIGGLLSNREILLNTFSAKFRSATANNSVSILSTVFAGARINVGTDGHFSNNNIVANRVLAVPGTNINIGTVTGGRGSGYFDSRYTLDADAVIVAQQGSIEATCIDNLLGNITYNNKVVNGVSTPIFAATFTGGPRPNGGAPTINFPSALSSSASVLKSVYDFEPNGATATITGFMANIAIGTRIVSPGASTMSYYTDLLLGVNDDGLNGGNLVYAVKTGMYVLPIKTASVTLAYGVYQEGTTDLNFFAGKMLIGSTVDNGAKLQVTGNQSLGVVTSAADPVTLDATASHYVFTGATATWHLPAIASKTGWLYFIKNRGSGILTVDMVDASVSIYSTGAVSSFTLNPGESFMFLNDGTYWNVE